MFTEPIAHSSEPIAHSCSLYSPLQSLGRHSATNQLPFETGFNGKLMPSCHPNCHQQLQLLLRRYVKQLTSLVDASRHKEALSLFSHIHSTFPRPIDDALPLCLALKSSSSLRLPILSSSLHAFSLKSGFLHSNPFIASSLIHSLGRSHTSPNPARQLFDEIPLRNVVVWNTMISLYSCSGDTSSAIRLLHQMDVEPNASTFNSIIRALANTTSDGSPQRALGLYRKMQSLGIRPNLITILALLPAAVAASAALGSIKEIHGYATRSYFHGNFRVGSSLVEAYGRCGGLELARRLFERTPARDVVAWSAMISSYASHGQPEKAMDLFRRMDAADVRPDAIMFLTILKACSHAGFADEALRFFELMRGRYGLEAGSEHYACLVDVLGRVGRLQEAYRVIEGMPVEVTASAWGALLGSCRSYGNVELAEIAAGVLFRIEPGNPANRILLSNLYASLGRFEDAEKVRREWKDTSVKIRPGSSWFTSARECC